MNHNIDALHLRHTIDARGAEEYYYLKSTPGRAPQRCHHRVDGPAIIWPDGSKEWYLQGDVHRGDGLPAVIRADGLHKWYQKGKLHRVGQPAVTHPTGEYYLENYDAPHPIAEWWVDGLLHRHDGPATTFLDGSQQWCSNGELHRIGGPAEVFADGAENWCENGRHHRAGAPAVIRTSECAFPDGVEEWWDRGERHRIGAPAVKYFNGSFAYFERGDLHRLDGPATIMRRDREGADNCCDDEWLEEWFVRGQSVTDEVAAMIDEQGYRPWQCWNADSSEWIFFRLRFC